MSITIEVIAGPLRRALNEAKRRCRNQRRAWNEIGRMLMSSIQKNFEAGGRPEKWDPIKDRDKQRSRRRRKKKGKILEESGSLRKSIEHVAFTDSVDVGSNLPYAGVHQWGSDTIEARPYLIVQEEDERTICETLEDFITRPLR